jgi:hypothetical protein
VLRKIIGRSMLRRYHISVMAVMAHAQRCQPRVPLADRQSPLLTRVGFVPGRVERPFRALQARRPAPLMVATRTAPPSRESVPARSATCIEIFRITAAGAEPTVRRFGVPPAKRTANPAKVDACPKLFALTCGGVGGFLPVEQEQKHQSGSI